MYLDVFEQPASTVFSSILLVALSLIPHILSALREYANREMPYVK